MNLTWRDAVATLCTAGVVAVAVARETGGWAIGVRPAAALALVVGLAGCISAGAMADDVYGAPGVRAVSPSYTNVMSSIGGLTMVALLGAIVLGEQVLLVAGVVLTITLWVAATVRHAFTRPERRPVTPV